MSKVDEKVLVTVMGKTLLPGGLVTGELVDRCTVGAWVMREREGAIMITSGGHSGGTGVMEAEVMKQMMMERGVAEERIVMESAPESAMHCMS